MDLKAARGHIRHVDTDSVDAVVPNAHQRIVSEAGERHRQSRSEARDAGESPPLGDPAFGVKELLQRKLVVATENKVVLDIERGETITQA